MSLNDAANINVLWSSLIVEELIRQGADYFCLAPGSRSAPLAVAIARNPRARFFIHPDERGLGFHAMGYAAATGRPAVVVVTSGTAVANLFPSVIEASKKKIPLIVLSADRPPELRSTGANQTIDQYKIFGNYTRFDFDLPCPTKDIPPVFVLTTIAQIAYLCRQPIAGPVQLNCQFREPLAPAETGESWAPYLSLAKAWEEDDKPYTRYVPADKTISMTMIQDIVRRLQVVKQGLILVGKISGADQPSVLALSQRLGWPIFPDLTSGLRTGGKSPTTVAHFDQLLGVEPWAEQIFKQFPVDGVLHLGGRMTSKRVYDWIERLAPREYIMVINHPLRNDPLHRVRLRVEAPVGEFCRAAVAALSQRDMSGLNTALVQASEGAEQAIGGCLDGGQELTEPFLARAVSRLIPPGTGLFLASSMPVRDMDMFAVSDGPQVRISSNRGASGIDGTIASAAGFAIGLNQPVTLLIGDLAFGHDVNSLAMLKKMNRPLVVVLINNNGGGIFSFLPIVRHADVFEPFFAVPQDLNFAGIVAGFGIDYVCPKDGPDFIKVYQSAVAGTRSTVIEVKTDRAENLRRHQDLQAAVAQALQGLSL